MSNSMKIDQRLAKLNISELKSVEHVRSLQRDLLKLLKRSSLDPISYVGLEYCGLERCGRVDCSEACWFGTLRRRVTEVLAMRRMLEQRAGGLHKVIAWKPNWGCSFGELQKVKIAAAKAFMSRVLNGLYNTNIVAVGAFKVIPFGASEQRWISEVHVIVAGADEKALHDVFDPWVPETSVRISKVASLRETVDEVISCNTPRTLYQNERPEAAQRAEFYAWLANMKIGSRVFRYGCDKNFGLIANRTIAYKPRRQKARSRRRYPPVKWVSPPPGYFDD
jgi:hypothetical protein